MAVFPADTVYGLACDPESEAAAARLYGLKGRAPDKPAAVMFFSLDAALELLAEEVGPRVRSAFERLLPGPLTLLVPNPARRFPVACGPDPDTLGLRVPALGGPLAPLAAVDVPALQSSANRAGGPDPRRVADVPEEIRAGADLVLDAGPLPGTPSTVVDLRDYEDRGEWRVVREGALPRDELAARLG